MERSQLHDIFELLTAYVYFQPPDGRSMDYPCITYKRGEENVQFADNGPYRSKQRYEVTVMDRDPDGVLREMVSKLSLCKHDRFFAANNLNHDVFTLFF